MVTFNLQRYFGEIGQRVRRKQGKDKNRISMKRQRKEKGRAEGEGYGKKNGKGNAISRHLCIK